MGLREAFSLTQDGLGFSKGDGPNLEPLGLGAGLEEPEKSGGRTACNPTPRSETSSGTGVVGTGSACLLCAKLGRVKPGDGKGGAWSLALGAGGAGSGFSKGCTCAEEAALLAGGLG